VFLAQLNTPPGFAGHTDWRLSTNPELQGILAGGYPGCSKTPCIADVFGPVWADGDHYWTGTTYPYENLWAYSVLFRDAFVTVTTKTLSLAVRAVRSGG
jgi:hypothetical protein